MILVSEQNKTNPYQELCVYGLPSMSPESPVSCQYPLGGGIDSGSRAIFLSNLCSVVFSILVAYNTMWSPFLAVSEPYDDLYGYGGKYSLDHGEQSVAPFFCVHPVTN